MKTMLGVVILSSAFCLSGCTPKEACTKLKTACALVEFIGDDGKAREIELTKEEIEGAGKAAAAKRPGASRPATQ